MVQLDMDVKDIKSHSSLLNYFVINEINRLFDDISFITKAAQNNIDWIGIEFHLRMLNSLLSIYDEEKYNTKILDVVNKLDKRSNNSGREYIKILEDFMFLVSKKLTDLNVLPPKEDRMYDMETKEQKEERLMKQGKNWLRRYIKDNPETKIYKLIDEINKIDRIHVKPKPIGEVIDHAYLTDEEVRSKEVPPDEEIDLEFDELG